MASPSGVLVTAGVQTAAPKAPEPEVPVPRREHRSPEVSQAMAISRLPSPFTSPAAIAIGSRQPTRLPFVTVKFPEQLF